MTIETYHVGQIVRAMHPGLFRIEQFRVAVGREGALLIEVDPVTREPITPDPIWLPFDQIIAIPSFFMRQWADAAPKGWLIIPLGELT